MKKIVIFKILIAILVVTNLISIIIIKEQNHKLTVYNESFFMSVYGLIDNYQKTLDFEKKYIAETNSSEKENMLNTIIELDPVISKHSGSVRSLLTSQVPQDDFVALEFAISKEILLFINAETDTERREHMERLEVALKEFKVFINEQMKEQEICIFDSCD